MGDLVILLAEIIAGVIFLWMSLRFGRQQRQLGAVLSGAAGVFALADAFRRLTSTRKIHALSALISTATFLLIIEHLFPPISSFFDAHKKLVWLTPILVALALSSSFRIIGWGFWVVLFVVWMQEIGVDGAVTEWVQRQRAEADWRAANTHYVLAPKAQGYGYSCGIAPDAIVKCCNNTSQQLVVQYVGNHSPYRNRSIDYSLLCQF